LLILFLKFAPQPFGHPGTTLLMVQHPDSFVVHKPEDCMRCGASLAESPYAKAVGIKYVHLHQTRHTYARIVAEETGCFVETQEALDHENASTTRVYVQRITVKADKHSSKIAKRLKLPIV
jgi:site-specific recombinase XerD